MVCSCFGKFHYYYLHYMKEELYGAANGDIRKQLSGRNVIQA